MIDRSKILFPARIGETVNYDFIQRFKLVYDLKLQKDGGLGDQHFANTVVVPVRGLSSP